ncbi:MAG: ABC transporter permease, partial [Bacteroidetes bacterium]|nr:ABC transporter permease [Bacteroidota bacterium]
MKIPFAYTWRSLWARRLTTLLTLAGIALVAFVFASVLMLSRGVENTLIETGSEDNAIVLRKSATSELVSQIERDHANLIKTFPEGALRPDGKPFVSTETYVIINLLKRGSNDMGNISVRGISPEGLQLRSQVRLSAGRWFTFGTQEVVVG